MPRKALRAFAAVLLLAPLCLHAEEPVDLSMVTRIRDEGLRRSQVVETAAYLSDVIGPRLTGSPQMKEANEWTRKRLEEWGLANAHLEGWEFGRGWSYDRVAVHMVKPQKTPLFSLPKAWTPGTKGPVRGLAVRAEIEEEKDFEAWRGKLAGKIVLRDFERDLSGVAEPEPRRFSAAALTELRGIEISTEPEEDELAVALRRYRRHRAVNEFLAAEGALASLEVSNRSWGVIRVGRGGSRFADETPGVPTLMMAAEPYNRLVRLLDRGVEVELEIDLQAAFHDNDSKSYNTLAEIPGTDKKDEVVLVGAHLDSWHGATGATDNAAGCAVVMEAVRILKALGVAPRRTIRVALWSGEEQGLLGANAYVTEHLATRPVPQDATEKKVDPFLWKGPLTRKPGYDKLTAYFNLDGGAGRIRGIFAEGNAAVAPIFEAWLAPFHDLGADTVTLRPTYNTDHEVFDRIGLPGFQFIQDELDYGPRTHHSSQDTFDHLDKQDLMQASVVMASFLYHAAMRPEPLPRKPLRD
ncbi:MAG TPA: M20/M25/M40 family metallo-hydrolase [Thermoanaerobaculia bacterium]|nr:M20/M25/M40 family metallo-hydrolase [Thermoanaerobaculia bacterium]